MLSDYVFKTMINIRNIEYSGSVKARRVRGEVVEQSVCRSASIHNEIMSTTQKYQWFEQSRRLFLFHAILKLMVYCGILCAQFFNKYA